MRTTTGSDRAAAPPPGRRSKHPVRMRGSDRGPGEPALLQADQSQGWGISRQLEMAPDAAHDRPVGEGREAPPEARVTARTALHVEGKHALASAGPAQRDATGRAGVSIPRWRSVGGRAPRRLLGAAKPPAYRTGCPRGGGTHAANFSSPTHGGVSSVLTGRIGSAHPSRKNTTPRYRQYPINFWKRT